MGRAPCCDKANVKKGPWSPEEDAKLKSYIDQHGTGGNWIALPQKIGLKRCGKSCRLRWLNYLRPNIKHGGFSEEEDNIICSLYISIGSRWSIIAAQLPGRTDNDIKNYWNTRLKKKLLGKQRKEKHAAKGRGKAIDSRLMTYNYHHLPPLPPPVLPPIPYSNEEPRFNDHTSIRKLLIKLGGRFENDVKLQDPIVDEAATTQPVHLHNYPVDFISTEPYHDMIMSSMLPGSDEIARLMYENPQKLQGFDQFYDEIINNTTSIGGDQSMDWGEMNALLFAGAASSNNQGFLQGSTMEGFFVDHKMRYP